MVVMRSGELLHDPHPDNSGLKSIQVVWLITRRAGATAPSPLTRPAVPEGWRPSHQELYAMSKDAGQLMVMPPLEWLTCFSARVLAAAPQPEAQPTDAAQKGGV